MDLCRRVNVRCCTVVLDCIDGIAQPRLSDELERGVLHLVEHVYLRGRIVETFLVRVPHLQVRKAPYLCEVMHRMCGHKIRRCGTSFFLSDSRYSQLPPYGLMYRYTGISLTRIERPVRCQAHFLRVVLLYLVNNSHSFKT